MRNNLITRIIKPRYRILVVHSVVSGSIKNHVFVQRRTTFSGEWEYMLDGFMCIDFKSVREAFDQIHSWHKWRKYHIECVKFDSRRVF